MIINIKGFMLDPAIGEFVLTSPDMRIKPKHSIYSINEGNSSLWDDATREYIESRKYPKSGKPYGMSYL
jgi:fructose-1,6-bisphosphatase I